MARTARSAYPLHTLRETTQSLEASILVCLAKPDKNLDFGKLFLAIAKSPGKIPALMKLQKQTQFAAQQLAEVLEKIIAP